MAERLLVEDSFDRADGPLEDSEADSGQEWDAAWTDGVEPIIEDGSLRIKSSTLGGSNDAVFGGLISWSNPRSDVRVSVDVDPGERGYRGADYRSVVFLQAQRPGRALYPAETKSGWLVTLTWTAVDEVGQAHSQITIRANRPTPSPIPGAPVIDTPIAVIPRTTFDVPLPVDRVFNLGVRQVTTQGQTLIEVLVDGLVVAQAVGDGEVGRLGAFGLGAWNDYPGSTAEGDVLPIHVKHLKVFALDLPVLKPPRRRPRVRIGQRGDGRIGGDPRLLGNGRRIGQGNY